MQPPRYLQPVRRCGAGRCRADRVRM